MILAIILTICGIVLHMVEGALDAVCDTIQHHHNKSILPNNNWWNKTGWRNKYIDRNPANGRVQWDLKLFKMNKPVQLTDAWHFFKMWKIIVGELATTISGSIAVIGYYSDNMWQIVLGILMMLSLTGILRNSTFTLFYHKILIK